MSQSGKGLMASDVVWVGAGVYLGQSDSTEVQAVEYLKMNQSLPNTNWGCVYSFDSSLPGFLRDVRAQVFSPPFFQMMERITFRTEIHGWVYEAWASDIHQVSQLEVYVGMMDNIYERNCISEGTWRSGTLLGFTLSQTGQKSQTVNEKRSPKQWSPFPNRVWKAASCREGLKRELVVSHWHQSLHKAKVCISSYC